MQSSPSSFLFALAAVLGLGAGHALADSGASGGKCASLKAGIDSLSTDEGYASNRTYSVFSAILDVLGFDANRISGLELNTALVPSDRAWENFFLEIGGTNVDPLSLLKRNPDVFKQIVLHHFAQTTDGLSGSSATGLSKVIELDSEGFMNSRAICGMNDARFITLELEYTRASRTYTFSDQYSKHFQGSSTSTPCSGSDVTIHTVDTVLSPCPIPHMFQPESQFGCASIAAVLPQTFGALAYRESNFTGSIFDSLKHPNFSARRGPAGLTFFMPTPDALAVGGISDPAFLRLPGVVDHIISAHVIQGQVCLGGGGDVAATFLAGEGGRWEQASGDRPAERTGEVTPAKLAPGLQLGSNGNAALAVTPTPPDAPVPPVPAATDGVANLASAPGLGPGGELSSSETPPRPPDPEFTSEDDINDSGTEVDAPGRKLASYASSNMPETLQPTAKDVFDALAQRVSARARQLQQNAPVATDGSSSGSVAQEEKDPIFGLEQQRSEGAPFNAITLVTSDFCGPSATIEIVEGTGQYPASASIISPNGWSASTTSRVNIQVCGGFAHEIDTVLMPCPAEQYRSTAREVFAEANAVSSSAPVAGSLKLCALVLLLCSVVLSLAMSCMLL